MTFFGIPLAVYLCLPAAVFLYLILDLYPLVPKSASAIVKSGGFWLLWVVQCILTLIAYAIVRAGTGPRIDAAVGTKFAPVFTVFLAVIGALTFVQSLSFKIADHKLVDLQKPLENFRSKVLESIASKVADGERLRRMKLADLLCERFQGDVQELRVQYAHVMSTMGWDVGKVGKALTQLEHESIAANLPLDKVLAQKIAQVNIDRAQDLIKD